MPFHRSRNFVYPSASNPTWNAGGALVLTLLPAGHEPGLYLTSLSAFVLTAAAAGTVTIVFGFNQKGFGATTLSIGSANLTATVVIASTPRIFNSDGTAALTATLTPAGVTGSPVVNVEGRADMLG